MVDWVTGVTVKDGRVFVVGESETTAGSGAFTVKTYDSSNGSLLWDSYYDREGGGWDSASDVVADSNNKVFVAGSTTTVAGGSALTVRAYNTQDGRLLWQDNYDREGAGEDAAWGMTLKDGKVFAVGQTTSNTGGSAFAVRAYNAKDGKLLWEDNYDREGSLLDAAYRAVAKDGRVFVVGQTGSTAGGSTFAVRAYDASNGALLWQDNYDREGDGWDAAYEVVVDGNNVFVVGSTQTAAGGWGLTVRAYGASNGALLWQDNYDREGALTDTAYGATVKNGRLFVVGDSETTAGGSAYAIRAYDTSNGNLLWKNDYDREGSFRDEETNVAVVGNVVYTTGMTGTANGNALTVRAYDVSNGNLLYEDYQTPEASKQENWGIGIAIEENKDTGNKVFVAGTTETTAGGMGFAVRAYKAVAQPPPAQPFL
ncbi:MAG: PQQ-binding-like beta-propeller repeat protein [Planctomycetes bacterium]|nr:PQQ-binding-like beta-propeller repeat protein [Planctomycetota bacterium]